MFMKRKRLTMEQAKINVAQSAGARQHESNARFLRFTSTNLVKHPWRTWRP